MVIASFKNRELKNSNNLPLNMTELSFYGDSTVESALDKYKHYVQFDKCELVDYELGLLEEKKHENSVRIIATKHQISDVKKTNRFMFFKKGEAYNRYQTLSKQLDELLNNDILITASMEELNKNRFYDFKVLRSKLEEMLALLKFRRVDVQNKKEVIIQFYESSMPDSELIVLIQQEIEKMEMQLQIKKHVITQRYSNSTVSSLETMEDNTQDTSSKNM